MFYSEWVPKYGLFHCTVPKLLIRERYYMLKNAVVWDVTPCGSCKNQRLRATYHLHHQRDKNR
jgi:hypothetical protein